MIRGRSRPFRNADDEEIPNEALPQTVEHVVVYADRFWPV